MVEPPQVLSRQEQQRRTRRALVFAARAVFARDGYHGARLDVIAQEAGYSKGAVYSNFENKATLFLAVMDLNIQAVTGEPDPGAGGGAPEVSLATLAPGAATDSEYEEAVRGMSLATLEFIAMAARDPELARQTGQRMALLVSGYAEMAAEAGAVDGAVTVRELGGLMAAMDQGAAILSLAGAPAVSDAALGAGLQAVATMPTGEAGEGAANESGSRFAGHQRHVRERVAASIARQYLESIGDVGQDRSDKPTPHP